MNAIKFEQQNVVFAEKQKEYLPLPAYAQNNGIVTFCMELDDDEVKLIQKQKAARITVITFGRSAQPIRVGVVMPEFPISHESKFRVNPESWNEKSEATFKIEMLPIQIQTLKQSKKLWITVATFGTPLQPISMTLN